MPRTEIVAGRGEEGMQREQTGRADRLNAFWNGELRRRLRERTEEEAYAALLSLTMFAGGRGLFRPGKTAAFAGEAGGRDKRNLRRADLVGENA